MCWCLDMWYRVQLFRVLNGCVVLSAVWQTHPRHDLQRSRLAHVKLMTAWSCYRDPFMVDCVFKASRSQELVSWLHATCRLIVTYIVLPWNRILQTGIGLIQDKSRLVWQGGQVHLDSSSKSGWCYNLGDACTCMLGILSGLAHCSRGDLSDDLGSLLANVAWHGICSLRTFTVSKLI